MSRHEARVLLDLSHDARWRPQARGLEGRQLAMHFSLMLPDRSRLRLLNPRATRELENGRTANSETCDKTLAGSLPLPDKGKGGSSDRALPPPYRGVSDGRGTYLLGMGHELPTSACARSRSMLSSAIRTTTSAST